MICGRKRTVVWATVAVLVLAAIVSAEATKESPTTVQDEAAASEEQPFTFDQIGGEEGDPSGAGQSIWESLGENLRLNVDLLGRVTTTSRRSEPQGFAAVGLDAHKVFSDSDGDMGTMVLQPYLIRRDNCMTGRSSSTRTTVLPLNFTIFTSI